MRRRRSTPARAAIPSSSRPWWPKAKAAVKFWVMYLPEQRPAPSVTSTAPSMRITSSSVSYSTVSKEESGDRLEKRNGGCKRAERSAWTPCSSWKKQLSAVARLPHRSGAALRVTADREPKETVAREPKETAAGDPALASKPASATRDERSWDSGTRTARPSTPTIP